MVESVGPMKPRLFIGSSSESRPVAIALHENLERDAEVTIWTHDVFRPGQVGLHSLLLQLDQQQFAVFILAPDDLATVRGTEVMLPRDNVLFELGLFMGRLGPERCFVLTPSSPAVHIMSDIAGLNRLVYDVDRRDNSLLGGTETAAEKIRRAIRIGGLGVKTVETAHQILEAAARLIAQRAGLKEDEVRGFLHIYRHEDKRLVPVYPYAGRQIYEDAGILIPCQSKDDQNWYIISRAFSANRFDCAEVDWTADLEKIRHSRDIWPDLKSVVVHPVRPVARPDIDPIGTISFDSSKQLTELGWKTDKEFHSIVKLLAGAIHTVVTRV
jgi:hypothetical protein